MTIAPSDVFPGRNRDYARRYGITKEQAFGLWVSQGCRCGVCGRREPVGRGAWHIDHNHATGDVRGILCGPCNTGIGHLKDCPDILASALRYLGCRGGAISTSGLASLLHHPTYKETS